MEKNRIFGELITANLYALRKGAEGCEVVNYYDENAATVRIALDKTLTPAQNAQKYYKKYNKQKRTLAAVAPQKEEAESDLDYTESMLSALSRAENTLDLTEIEQELRDTGILPPEKKKVKNAPVVPFRVFAVGKFRILRDGTTFRTTGFCAKRPRRSLAAYAEISQFARTHPHGRA